MTFFFIIMAVDLVLLKSCLMNILYKQVYIHMWGPDVCGDTVEMTLSSYIATVPALSSSGTWD